MDLDKRKRELRQIEGNTEVNAYLVIVVASIAKRQVECMVVLLRLVLGSNDSDRTRACWYATETIGMIKGADFHADCQGTNKKKKGQVPPGKSQWHQHHWQIGWRGRLLHAQRVLKRALEDAGRECLFVLCRYIYKLLVSDCGEYLHYHWGFIPQRH